MAKTKTVTKTLADVKASTQAKLEAECKTFETLTQDIQVLAKSLQEKNTARAESAKEIVALERSLDALNQVTA